MAAGLFGDLTGNFFTATATVVDMVLTLYMYIIIARVIISWVSADPYNPIVRAIYSVTEPVLKPIRKFVGTGMGLDFSPLIVIAIIYFAKIFIIQSLFDIARRVK